MSDSVCFKHYAPTTMRFVVCSGRFLWACCLMVLSAMVIQPAAVADAPPGLGSAPARQVGPCGDIPSSPSPSYPVTNVVRTVDGTTTVTIQPSSGRSTFFSLLDADGIFYSPSRVVPMAHESKASPASVNLVFGALPTGAKYLVVAQFEHWAPYEPCYEPNSEVVGTIVIP